MLRISFSRILTGLYNNEICLYDAGFVGVLFGLGLGMILLFFKMCELFVCTLIWLKMSFRSIMVYGYRSTVFRVSVGYATVACGSCRFGGVYCCSGHVGDEWGREVG